jgi:broad specificity phosphatase PhoE
MQTLYIIRHDQKAWSNGRKPSSLEGHQHDPPLAQPQVPSESLGLSIARCQAITFDQVYCSPFLRTRQTEELIRQGLNNPSHPPRMLVAELGEYLGNQKGKLPLDISAEAFQHKTSKNPLFESISALKKRVEKFRAQLPSQGTFLIITHGIVGRFLCGKDLEEGQLHITEA